MGLRWFAAPVCAIFLAGGIVNHCLAEGEVTLQKQAWPIEHKCDVCVTVQFAKLEMRLPLTEIGKILVIDGGDSILHILPPSDAPKESVEFVAVPPERLLKRYGELGLLQGLAVANNEQLFDLLGTPPANNKALETLRQLQGIDAASQYLKFSRGAVHVYWIRSPLTDGSQKVYFVIDGEDVVYLLAGNVTKQFLESALANLRITAVP